ncbi:MAG: DUF2723 domain-containing protein [Bacteroidota bacterium]
MRVKIKSNYLTGLAVFIVSLSLYTLTLEPTTSFWDCSEFILSASKLEVNHPAGAPLFMLLGRIFSFLSFGNPEKIAWSINFMSGFFSALTIFFLFKVIVKLIGKISDNRFLITGSAVIGALTFAVTDSFWFSAVEGEVYALSMFFLILSFWAALKWAAGFNQSGNEKWIFFLALITGLGIGVHLLNLLVLPSVVMIFGFKRYGYSVKSLVLSFVAGVFVLLGILYVMTPAVMKMLAYFDYVFVNKFNLQLHSGTISGIVFILLLFVFLNYYFRKKNREVAQILAISVLMILIGFSVYSVNLIRSSANPPVNFGRPDNIYSLINYLNREQYPKRPLIYGQSYNSPVTGVNERFSKNYLDGKYKSIDLAPTYDFDSKTTTFFPRMYSRDEKHIQTYNSWIDIRGKRISVKQPSGQREFLVVPRFSDHLRYFMKYQFGYMFGRYFMWNFVGRQNDRQGRGGLLNGNWISGVRFIDDARLGPQNKLPDWMKNNRGRNTYFFIPFLLGLAGAYFHYKKHRPTFFIVLALFIMGGLGLTVYINEVPITPRERDYVFVGAFLAFSIWIGISFMAIANYISKIFKTEKISIPVFVLLLAAAPGLMAFQNFDDHNRADRYAAHDFAANILNSCPQNTILFTSGDNDTYPLLYCQEVEGIRTDVRVVIMPFLAANWFTDGLRTQKYDDAGLQMTLPQKKYDSGDLDYIPVLDRISRDTSWKEAFVFLKSDNENAKVKMSSGEKMNFLPLTNLNFQIKAEDRTGEIKVSLKDKKYLYKHQLVFWDIVSSNATSRPLCFVSKAEAQKYGLNQNLQCEGFVYRLVPEKSKSGSLFSMGNCDAEKMYEKLTNDFNWGNISDPSVYVGWNTIYNLNVFQVRNVFNEVALMLLQQGKKDKAATLLELSAEQFPVSKIPYDIFTIRHIELMVNSGLTEKAMELFTQLEKNVTQTLHFYFALPQNKQTGLKDEIQRELYYLNSLVSISEKFGDKDKTEVLKKQLDGFVKQM